MEKIYSQLDPSKLLHIIIDRDFFEARNEVIPKNNFLQVATLALVKEDMFLAHRHIDKPVNFSTFHAQEAWVILTGAVEVTYFDLDDTEISKRLITSGQVTITLSGGHSYRALENSQVLEFKTGPYLGAHLDKIRI